jgi:hypothetical protein
MAEDFELEFGVLNITAQPHADKAVYRNLLKKIANTHTNFYDQDWAAITEPERAEGGYYIRIPIPNRRSYSDLYRLGQRHLFLEEWHGIVAQIDNLEIGVIALFGDIEQPVRGDIGKPPGTGRADDDSDFGSFLHSRFPNHLRLVSH